MKHASKFQRENNEHLCKRKSWFGQAHSQQRKGQRGWSRQHEVAEQLIRHIGFRQDQIFLQQRLSIRNRDGERSLLGVVMRQQEITNQSAAKENRMLRQQNRQLNTRFRQFVKKYKAQNQEISKLRNHNNMLKQLLELEQHPHLLKQERNIHQEIKTQTVEQSLLMSYLPLETDGQGYAHYYKRPTQSAPVGRLADYC